MPQKKSEIPKADRDRAYYERNKPRILAYRKAWYAANSQRQKDERLLAKFGITRDDYDTMMKRQEGCCWICRTSEAEAPKGVLMVDHDHATNKVRGLLCLHCNLGLGYFKDQPRLLDRAQRYLSYRRL